MDRAAWRRLAEERIADAEGLLQIQRWAAAYYLAGYAVECGLKSCVLAFVESNPDVVFRVRKYSENCWTHDLGALVGLADLQRVRDADALANPALDVNWGLVQGWSEKKRYEFTPEPEARRYVDAVTHATDGVLPWIRTRW